MGRAEDIQEQRRRLNLNRQKLAAVLGQIAQQGEAYALPGQIATRREARAEIARITAVLRGWGETVEDHPDDLAPAVPPTPSGAAIAHGSTTQIHQPNMQVQGSVYNVHGTVNVTHVTPPPPAPAYPPSPAPTTPIEALVQPFPFSSRPQVRSMLETYTEIFGGRAAELSQFDAFLHAATPYALLLAPTGRGKTALLIQWAIQVAARGGWQVIFVPISIRYQTAAADVVFRTLALALATIHGEQAQFDGYRQTPEDLRAISADYLRRPPPEGQQVLLVLDGLDEAVGWELRAGLFPRTPPVWLRVVCAARQVAHKTLNDWLRDLDWRKDLVWRAPLAGLDDAAVQDILLRMGNPLDDLATDVDFIKEIGRVSAGDPLTIRMLIEALRDGDLQPKKLTAMTPGLEAFVREWLDDLEAKSAQHAGIRTLLGLCAVALGPLMSDDLAALAPEVFPHGAGLKQTAGVVARVLIGDGTDALGYVFSHSRLRELFGERVLLQHERVDFQACFVAYGEQRYAAYCRDPQAQPIPTYVRQFWVAHLVAAGVWDKARMVLTEVIAVQTRTVQPWATARYAAEGSYAGYLTDLDRLWGHAEKQQDLVLAIRCALIAASIRSLSGNLFPALLVGLVTVGTSEGKWSVPTVLEHIRQMPYELQQTKAIQALARIGAVTDREPLLALVREIVSDAARARALVGVAPHVAEGAQAGVWGEALAAARGVGDLWERADILIEIAPHVAEGVQAGVWGEALAAARGIAAHVARALILARVAPHVAEGAQAGVWEEALAAARKSRDAGGRARALVGVAPHVAEGAQAGVWGEALAAARGVEDTGVRANILIEIAPHVAEGAQAGVWGEALAAARGIKDKRVQASALVGVAPHLAGESQAGVWREALAVVGMIADERVRAWALVGVAPHLPEWLGSEILARARGVRDPWVRAEALVGVAPHLPERKQAEVWREAFAAVRSGRYEGATVRRRKMGDMRSRAQILVEIAPHLPEEEQLVVWGEALAEVWGTQDAESRAEVLVGMVPHLPEEEQAGVWREMFAVVREIRDPWVRADMVVGVVPHLSEELLDEMLVVVRGRGFERTRARVLVEIAPYLPEGEQAAVWSEALVAAQGMRDVGARAEALGEIAPHLPEGEQMVVWQEALVLARGMGDEEARVMTLIGVAPHLPEAEEAGLWWEVLALARGMGDERARVRELARVALHLPEEEQTGVWREVLALARGMQDVGARAEALARVAPHLPEGEQMVVWQEALALARGMGDEDSRAMVLVDMTPHMPEGLVGEVLAMARGMEDDWSRAWVLVEVAPHLPQSDQAELCGEVLVAAQSVDAELMRAETLADLAPQCVSHRFPRRTLLSLLRPFAARGRPDFLSDLAALMPWIVALTTPEERIELVRAVREVAACWS